MIDFDRRSLNAIRPKEYRRDVHTFISTDITRKS